jgi:hypothetical protein
MKNAGEARCPGRRQDLCPLAGLLVPLGDLVSYPHARERKSRLSGRPVVNFGDTFPVGIRPGFAPESSRRQCWRS